MLQCNMTTSIVIQLALDDLLADLHHARRSRQLGRLALLAYCEVRSWARQAGKPDIADSASTMFTENPCVSKEEFLENVDNLIRLLERHQSEYQRQTQHFSWDEQVASHGAAC
jgi:hypothetical protein